MKVYVVVENQCGVLNSVTIYKNYEDAKEHFDSCVEEDFVEIITGSADPNDEGLYARDNDDCDYEITVWPTELK